MKLTIIVPVYISHPLHLDFTRQTLESIQTPHNHQILIVINYCSTTYKAELNKLVNQNTYLVTNPQGNILASSWNVGLDFSFNRGRGHQETISDYCLIINNDIIFHPDCINNLVKFAQDRPDFMLWSASQWSNLRTLKSAPLTDSWSPHPHFSCFMVSSQTVTSVGLFDEHFTMGYFEDNDYHTRILQKSGIAAATDSAKFYHYGSRTVAVDDNLTSEAKYHYQLNRKYFQKKWGIDIHGRAFNPPEEILKYIKPSPAFMR